MNDATFVTSVTSVTPFPVRPERGAFVTSVTLSPSP